MSENHDRTPDGFLLNEPAIPVAGGTQRKSVLVDRTHFPEVLRRERMNQRLLVHDLEAPTGGWKDLQPEDLALLRQMANEGVITQQEPAIRYQAILMLGQYPTAENLNLLDQLGRFGEDVYVRSHALAALGNTGLRIVGPVLREALTSESPLEREAAFQALSALGRVVGAGAIRALAREETRAGVRETLEQVTDQLTRQRLDRSRAARQTRPVGVAD